MLMMCNMIGLDESKKAMIKKAHIYIMPGKMGKKKFLGLDMGEMWVRCLIHYRVL